MENLACAFSNMKISTWENFYLYGHYLRLIITECLLWAKKAIIVLYVGNEFFIFRKWITKKEQIGTHFNEVSFDTFTLSKENI